MVPRLVSLMVLAVLCGVAWRAELELTTGWNSLKWVNESHWAVPGGIFAFIGWTLWAARVKRPVWFTAALLLFAVVGYFATLVGLTSMFVMGPLAMLFPPAMDLPESLWWVRLLPNIFAWALIPLCFGGLCRLFGAKVPLNAMLLSAVGFVASWPIAVSVRPLFETRGSPDMIHALKSGLVIPLLVFSLGAMLLPLPEPQSGGTSQR